MVEVNGRYDIYSLGELLVEDAVSYTIDGATVEYTEDEQTVEQDDPQSSE